MLQPFKVLQVHVVSASPAAWLVH